MKQGRIYPLYAIEQLISSAAEAGYQILQISEGTLGLGHVLLIAPKAPYKSFEIMEEYRNPWTAVNRLRHFTRISARIQKLIDSMEV